MVNWEDSGFPRQKVLFSSDYRWQISSTQKNRIVNFLGHFQRGRFWFLSWAHGSRRKSFPSHLKTCNRVFCTDWRLLKLLYIPFWKLSLPFQNIISASRVLKIQSLRVWHTSSCGLVSLCLISLCGYTFAFALYELYFFTNNLPDIVGKEIQFIVSHLSKRFPR